MNPLVAEGLPWVPMATAAVLALLVAIGIVFYNQLVALDVRTDNAWSDIDVQLKRRHDLIPNVVEAVKGYMGYEKGALEAVVAARAEAMNARGPQAAAAAENGLTGALKSLFALAEAYPDLKANEQFSHLQGQLAGIEDSIQSARRYFNATVRELNTTVRMFPWNLLAGWGGFKAREFFEIGDAAERAVPSVKLG